MKMLPLLAVSIALLLLQSCTPKTSDEQTSDATEKRMLEKSSSLWTKVGNHEKRELGDSISIAAQQTLMANVKAAMKRGGPTEAVNFCNLKAMPLTDSLSKRYGVSISRISTKNRNPKNVPTDLVDEDIMSLFAQQKASGEPMATKMMLVKDENETLRFYKPIMIGMPTCLKCHGEPNKDIAPATLSMIRERYPDGRAINYKQGDLRGSWKIVFEN